MSNLKFFLRGLAEILIGVILLLIFSFCMYLGSTMLGEKAVDSQEKLHSNDSLKIEDDSIELDTLITVQDTVN